MLRQKNFLVKCSARIITGIVSFTGPLISQGCEIFWYQEKEPEGFDEFVARKRDLVLNACTGDEK